MLLAEFRNAVRIAQSLDAFALMESGLSSDQVLAYTANPAKWLVTEGDDAELAKVWGLISARLPGDVLPTAAHAEKAAHFLAILGQAREHGKDWWAEFQYQQILEHVRADQQIAALTNGVNALLGLIQMIAGRDDMPDAIKSVLAGDERNHRIDEAEAALALAAPDKARAA